MDKADKATVSTFLVTTGRTVRDVAALAERVKDEKLRHLFEQVATDLEFANVEMNDWLRRV